MMSTKPTKEIAIKVRDTVSCGLVKGLGVQEPGKMCIEAAVCYAYGLPHSDNPPCVGSAVRSFKISLNDADWSSEQARSKGMIKIAIAQLGSNEINQVEFAKKLTVKTINTFVADLAIKYAPDLEEILRKGDDLKALEEACMALQKAAGSAARSAARSAESAAESARSAARSAWSAAWSAARSAR
jgi:hypothetical protein